MLSFIGESLQASSLDLLLWILWHLPFEKDEGKLGQTLPLERGVVTRAVSRVTSHQTTVRIHRG
jgi:hypothetical protein